MLASLQTTPIWKNVNVGLWFLLLLHVYFCMRCILGIFFLRKIRNTLELYCTKADLNNYHSEYFIKTISKKLYAVRRIIFSFKPLTLNAYLSESEQSEFKKYGIEL